MTDADASKHRTVTATRVTSGSGRDDGDFTYYVVTTAASAGKATRQASAQADGERRAGARVRTRLRDATLSEPRGRVLAECRIHDRSRHGARLQLDKDCPLPKTFALRDPAAGVDYQATLVWQKGREAGIRLAP